jgi:hypothetical protein
MDFAHAQCDAGIFFGMTLHLKKREIKNKKAYE